MSKKNQESLLKAINQDKWPILLFGKPGTGKSCAAACIYCAWKRFSYWRDFTDLMSEMSGLKRTNPFFSNSVPFQGFREAELMVIDDIGIREQSGSIQENFTHLLKARYDLKTIYTSNGDPASLIELFDDRIIDRLTCGTTIKFEGTSRR